MAEKSSEYIVDASCLIKWVGLEAENLEQAEMLRLNYKKGQVNITVPAMAFWELGNYLGRELDEKSAASVFNNIKNYQFTQTLVTLEVAALTFHLMKKCPGTSFYDASYHALAIQNEATFLTADKKYYDKAKKLGHIQLLKDYH